MMEKTEEKRSVKSRIISAAWELFRDKGFGNTTVDDIIEKSGTSKGSFYYYFSAKDKLLNTLAEILDDYYRELEKKLDPGSDCFEKLMYLNREVHTMMEKNISMDLIASLYSTQLVSQGASQLLNENREYYKLIYAIVDEGQKKGEICPNVPVRTIVKYYAMCERALVTEWCLGKGEHTLEEYSRKYFPLMMESFRGNQSLAERKTGQM